MAIKRCGLKGCKNQLVPGSAEVGYEIEGKTYNVKVCPEHTWLITTAPRGTWHITPDRELKGISARPTIIDLKGRNN